MLKMQQVREEQLHERRVLGVERIKQRFVVFSHLDGAEHDLRQRVVHALLAQPTLLFPDSQDVTRFLLRKKRNSRLLHSDRTEFIKAED